MVTKLAALVVAAFASALVGVLADAGPASGATFTVTKTADTADGVCNVDCSLREAIVKANATPGADTIAFSISGPVPHTIQPISELPTITGPLIIDGTTEPSFSGSPIVELDGIMAGGFSDGIEIAAGGSTVRGLAINRFYQVGVRLHTNGGNTIEGNFIGTDVSGNIDRGNGSSGVLVDSVPNNRIGGVTAPARNVISGNDGQGISLGGSSNVVLGNYIGVNSTGNGALGNLGSGVLTASSNNTIGGTATGAGNVISANVDRGVLIYEPGSGNTVQGNLIGTSADGSADLGNAYTGVFLFTASNNTIGGSSPGAGNVISGTGGGIPGTGDGIHISRGANGNVVKGNYVGTNGAGTGAVVNSGRGIYIDASANNIIGGTEPGARNVISGNGRDGIDIEFNSPGNEIRGNFIGTDVSGTLDLGNLAHGVNVQPSGSPGSAPGIVIGPGNVISGNEIFGIAIVGNVAAGIQVYGNLIGTKADGSGPLGNGRYGVWLISGTHDHTIGGTAEGAGNTIAFNGWGGIYIESGSNSNRISRNSIFANTGLGIDLGPNGVSPNDILDGDFGGNRLQNFPLVTHASQVGGTTTLMGRLDSEASTDYTLEFFASPICDGSGYGEGRQFIGSTVLLTDGVGGSIFAASGLSLVPPGHFVTATAANANSNDTSEFSNCLRTCPGTTDDCDGDNSPDVSDPDDDNDSWHDAAEATIGTNPLSNCGFNAWPPDINNETFVDTSDIAFLTGQFGNAVPPAPARHNIAPNPPDGFIDTIDIARMTAFFGLSCS